MDLTQHLPLERIPRQLLEAQNKLNTAEVPSEKHEAARALGKELLELLYRVLVAEYREHRAEQGELTGVEKALRQAAQKNESMGDKLSVVLSCWRELPEPSLSKGLFKSSKDY